MASTPELREVDVDQFVFLRRNPQYLTPHEMESLKKSIERDGFLAPILVRPVKTESGDGFEIVSGNHRAMAAKELGYKKVPAVIVEMDDRSAQRAAVNLNTVHGTPSAELLAPFLAEMDDELLKTIHLDDALLNDVKTLDATLAERLSNMEVPEEWDSESVTSTIEQCVCDKCGRRHIAGRTRKN